MKPEADTTNTGSYFSWGTCAFSRRQFDEVEGNVLDETMQIFDKGFKRHIDLHENGAKILAHGLFVLSQILHVAFHKHHTLKIERCGLN